jgi:glucose-6-phosphate 1-dehydrogenase
MSGQTRDSQTADVFVAFGVSGDLARKMTFVSLYQLERRGLLTCPIIGVAAEKRLCGRMSYVGSDFADPATFAALAGALGKSSAPVFYLEIPPSLFSTVVEGLSAAGLTKNARVEVEKPVGHDLQSAQGLNAKLRSILAVVAMEPPARGDLDSFFNRKHDVFAAMPAANPSHYVRGQFDGYRQVAGVAADSAVETYAALRLEVDNWRWSGVPFFVRAGKSLPLSQTEVRLVFKTPPSPGFSASGEDVDPNQIVLLIDPRPGARWVLHAKRSDGPGLRPIDLDVDFSSDGERIPAPYEELLYAAMQGDQTHFTREDSVEETWRILDPLLDLTEQPHPYPPGSWGPAAAEQLTAEFGGWHQPWQLPAARNS